MRLTQTLACSLALPATAIACPICDTPTGEAVRTAIFNADFFPTMSAVLLPFPVLLVALLIINRVLSDSPAIDKKETAHSHPFDS